jgi:hypothetical protein
LRNGNRLSKLPRIQTFPGPDTAGKGQITMNGRTISILAGVFLLVMGAFLGGMWTTHKTWWAWRTTEDAQDLWRSWRATGKFLRANSYAHRAGYAPDEPYTVHDAAALADGHLLISRIDPKSQRPVAELVDTTGEVLHTWPIDHSRMVEGGAANEFPHTATLLPDGSILVNVDDQKGLARLDACGDPVWVKADMIYHHMISRGQDGYWIWAEPDWDGGHNQRLVRFDPESGETLETISLLDDLIARSPENRVAFTMPAGMKFEAQAIPDETTDFFHPNDIEELSPALAPAFPQFRAGDLLISLRNLDLVAVIDRQTLAVKWAQYGPWRDQHDPDFEADGTISVYSNNGGRNRSTIIVIDPRTNSAREAFGSEGVPFSSFIMGRHERLENGNWLIASPMEGRVLEATADGRLVREFNNILDEGYNNVLSSVEFVPKDYLAEIPVCDR